MDLLIKIPIPLAKRNFKIFWSDSYMVFPFLRLLLERRYATQDENHIHFLSNIVYIMEFDMQAPHSNESISRPKMG